jgi:hypothetical protein
MTTCSFFLCETSGVASTKIQLCIGFQTYSRILVWTNYLNSSLNWFWICGEKQCTRKCCDCCVILEVLNVSLNDVQRNGAHRSVLNTWLLSLVFSKSKVCGLQSIERILIYIRAFSIHNRSLHIRSNIWIRRRYRKFQYSVNADNPNVRPTKHHIRHHSNRYDVFLNSVETLKMTWGFEYKQ